MPSLTCLTGPIVEIAIISSLVVPNGNSLTIRTYPGTAIDRLSTSKWSNSTTAIQLVQAECYQLRPHTTISLQTASSYASYRPFFILFAGCLLHAGHSQSPTGSSLMPTHSQWNH
jgi:hypothetical protein